MVLGAIILVFLFVLTYFLLIFTPEQESNPNTNSWIGLKAGDEFYYSASGTYNGSTVTGDWWNMVDQGPGSWASKGINTSNPELNAILDEASVSWFSNGWNMGTSEITTPFGVKNVVWNFIFRSVESGFGLAVIEYRGVDPNVPYGYVINGEGLHLEVVLNETDNVQVKDGNTRSLTWHGTYSDQKAPDSDSWRSSLGDQRYSPPYYIDEDRLLVYDITAVNADLFVFSEGNIRSMAEGGPFAFNIKASILMTGNVTGEALIPKGVFIFCFAEYGSGDAWFNYSLT
jgi:hypothetical protein